MTKIQKRFLAYSALGLLGVYVPTLFSILNIKVPVISLMADLAQLGAYVCLFAVICFAIYFTITVKQNKIFLFISIVLIFIFGSYYSVFNNFFFVEQSVKNPIAKPHLMVASSNVHYQNERVDKAAQWAIKNKPDVISFIEVSKFQTDKLNELLNSHYPYIYISQTQGAFGIVVYSKKPFEHSNFYYDDGKDEPFFNGMWHDDKISLNIGVMHPMLPIPHENLIKRDKRIMELANIQRENALEGSLIMGDFNATRTSTAFRELAKNFSYKIAPASSYFSVVPFLILIDHVLLSGDKLDIVSSGHEKIEFADHYVVWSNISIK